MARKKQGIAVLSEPETGLALSDQWEADMAAEAKDVSAKEVSYAPRISFKGGRLSVAGTPVKDNVLEVVVVDAGFSKAYYTEAFDADHPTTPKCYAFGRDEGTLKPHPQAPEPQSGTCAVCPHNKFGTADQGKGKACKDERRLMVIPGDTKAQEVQKAEVVMAIVPPTSLKNWGNYVKALSAMGRTPWSVVTKLSVEPLKSYFQILFEPVSKLDGIIYAAVKAKQPVVEGQMFAPYPTLEEGEEEQPKKAKRSKKY